MTNTSTQNNSIPTYDQYKDTGIPWLGKIPAHWEIERAKYFFNKVDERSKSGLEELLSVSEHFGVIKRKDTNVNMFKAASYIGYKLCKKNDLVINSLWAWKGGLGISDFNGIISTAYSVFRFVHNEIFPKYFHYLFRSSFYLDAFRILSKGIWISRLQLNDDDFLNLFVVFPPKPEQTAIARFLDSKTTQIGQAIAQKQALIDRLKTYKQVLIQQAVTKGLNPDAPLKDSGVEWIGKIPAHWEVRKLKSLGIFSASGIDKKIKKNEKPIRIVNYTDVFGNRSHILKNSDRYMKVTAPENVVKKHSLKKGDLLFLPSSETYEDLGLSALIDEDLINTSFSYHLLKFHFSFDIDHKYKKYLTNNHFVLEQFSRQGKGSTRKILDRISFKNIIVILPPKPEQTAIANFLDRKTTQIDHSIALQEQEIKHLQAYKTVLIDQAVTGKIKVI